MADIQINKTNRDRLGDRLKAKYPDREYADDEALYGQVNDELDEYDGRIAEYQDREDKLNDLLRKDPKNAQFLADMARGDDPWLGIIRRVGTEGLTAMMEDPAKQEEFAKANQEFIDRLAKERELQQQYEQNLQESLRLLEQIQQQRGLSDEQMDAAYDLINKMAHGAIMGTYSEETIDMALKALNHDAAVEEAGAQGELRGRNARIEERLRRPSQGDGTAQLAQGASGPQGPQRRRPSVFEEAELAQ